MGFEIRRIQRDWFGGPLAVFAALLTACAASDEDSPQVLKLSVVTAPGVVKFDKQRLIAKAGRLAFELTNDKQKGHNIRIYTGDTCCFGPGSKDIGGTRTIGPGRTRVVLSLKPGTYTYLCSTGGYWRTGRWWCDDVGSVWHVHPFRVM